MSSSKPFSLLIKPASADCNLRCEYCFYLDHASLYPETSRHRMSGEVLERLVSSYMATNQAQYAYGWQGGEPTLMGLDFFRRVTELQQRYGRSGSVVANGLQTNAVLLDDEFCAHLAKYNFLVGVSLDGPAEIHDRYRTAGGRGTHAQVMRGIEALRRQKTEFNILTLVTAANVGLGGEIYRYLRDQGFYYHQYIPCVEFAPDGKPLPYTIDGPGWGGFLCEVFDEWSHQDTRLVSVRLFDALISLMVEGIYHLCHFGGSCREYFVVEYNGDVYPCDFFVEPGLKMGNVMSNSWDQLGRSDLYRDFGRQKAEWNDKCAGCQYLRYCSGDCLKHRLYGGRGPANLSWLCDGWRIFLEHSLPRLKSLAGEILHLRGKDKGFFDPKPGRNEPCFCGSGLKFKRCHGRAGT